MSTFRWADVIDINEVRKTINTLKPNHELFEVRIFGSEKKGAVSGYFTNCNTLIKAFDSINPYGKNIYITLNKVNEALYSRLQHDKFIYGVNTTSDTEIDRYEWLFVDLDPIRPTNISSTDAELAKAEELKDKVKTYLAEMGFSEPVEAASGNGYHLLYRIDLSVDDGHKQLLNDCLTALAGLFNNLDVKIDTVNYNPARICKLHGTLAQKGADTPERPHRMSRILSVPERIQPTDEQILRKLAAEIPEEAPKPGERSTSKFVQAFDVRSWLDQHGLTYRETTGDRSQVLMLDECPFDHSHRNGDSKIFIYPNGAVSFKCHHNSCRGYKWQDVRRKFEPDAYEHQEDDARIEAGWQKHKQQLSVPEEIPLPGDTPEIRQKKEPPKIRHLKRADKLMEKDIPEPEVFIGVGDELPILVEGTCILSAKPKLGKSWFALAMCLAIASGEDFLGYKVKRCSTLYLDLETSESIQKKRLSKALKGKPVPDNFYLETETNAIENGFVEQIEAYLIEDPKIKVVVVDVFQIIRSPAKNFKESEYEHAYRDITPLNELAQKYHIAIILVCHDRKAVDPDDPFSNILGSTGLQGAASQMIVMFRKRKTDPIHISVKGKTIDGLPDLDVKLDNAEWSVVDGASAADRERAEALNEYLESPIRAAVVKLAENPEGWRGRCSELINAATEIGIGIIEEAKYVGGFLHRHQGKFLSIDEVKLTIINNGSGGKTYKIEHSPLMTVDGREWVPLMEPEEAHKYGIPEEWLS